MDDNDGFAADRMLRVALALIVLGATAYASHSGSGQAAESHMSKSTIQDVLKRHTDFLMAIPGVRGVAIGESEGKPCILVLVVQKTTEVMANIPSQLEGFPVVVEESGAIRRLGARSAVRPH